MEVSYKETMPAATLAIGDNIRALRQQRGLSLAGMAERSGFSKGFLSKIENGHAQPPIATLMKLADALDVELGACFDGSRPSSKSGGSSVLTRRAEREHIPHSAERGYAFERLAVGSPFQATPYIIHLDEEQEAPRRFQHPGEEIIHVLAGELDYLAGGELHRLAQGDTLVFDASQPHGPIKLPGVSASFLAVFAGTPG